MSWVHRLILLLTRLLMSTRRTSSQRPATHLAILRTGMHLGRLVQGSRTWGCSGHFKVRKLCNMMTRQTMESRRECKLILRSLCPSLSLIWTLIRSKLRFHPRLRISLQISKVNFMNKFSTKKSLLQSSHHEILTRSEELWRSLKQSRVLQNL